MVARINHGDRETLDAFLGVESEYVDHRMATLTRDEIRTMRDPFL